ncbi:MAG: hypothetical protein JSS82_12415 [Bacteroidetes bacterium]|nr:hypothetical protein [Bacteroidota bacterium]
MSAKQMTVQMTDADRVNQDRKITEEYAFHEFTLSLLTYCMHKASMPTHNRVVTLNTSTGRLPQVDPNTGMFKQVLGSRTYLEDHPEQF